MTKVLVCGGRHYTNKGVVFATLDELHNELGITEIIEGGQRTRSRRGEPWIGDASPGPFIGGADYWGNVWGKERRIPMVSTFPANWYPEGPGTKLDRAAGFKRNALMCSMQPDMCVAFPGGNGTADMVARCVAAGIQVLQILK